MGITRSAALLVAIVPSLALAQFSPPPQKSVTVSGGSIVAYPPDGGMPVTVQGEVRVASPLDVNISGQSNTLDVNITNAYVPVGMGVGAPRLLAEVTGPLGAPVTVDGLVAILGTVSLSASSLAAITAATAERVCTYGTPVIVAALTTTPSAQPSVAQVGRTEITLTNLQTDSRELWCRVSGTPSSTNAIVMKAGVTVKLNVTDAQAVNCMCSQSTCRINFQEAACSHP